MEFKFSFITFIVFELLITEKKSVGLKVGDGQKFEEWLKICGIVARVKSIGNYYMNKFGFFYPKFYITAP
jgi:hypothetical protein